MSDPRKIAAWYVSPASKASPDQDTLARAYLAAMAEIDRLRAQQAWRPIDDEAKSGEPVLIARHMPIWGWVRGWGQWVDVRGIAGFISHGFYDPPGELGLAHPTLYMTIPTPPAAGKGDGK